MRIEDYFQRIHEQLANFPFALSSNMTYDKRGSHEGFIRGEVLFTDGSILHLREYVDVESAIDRLVYAYQYMDSNKMLVFRYDNTGHHKNAGLATYPHHKHVGDDADVRPSSPPALAEVLAEIERLVELFTA